jgi:hypothetical protein
MSGDFEIACCAIGFGTASLLVGVFIGVLLLRKIEKSKPSL